MKASEADVCVCVCVCGWRQGGSARVEWKFSQCCMRSQRRPVLEVRGNAGAAVEGCVLAGLCVNGEVNRCSTAVLLKPYPLLAPAPAQQQQQQGTDRDPDTADDALVPPQLLPCGPHVDISCSVLRHSDCGVRVLGVLAAVAMAAASDGMQDRVPQMQAEVKCVNSMLEQNQYGLILTHASRVLPCFRSSSPLPRCLQSARVSACDGSGVGAARRQRCGRARCIKPSMSRRPALPPRSLTLSEARMCGVRVLGARVGCCVYALRARVGVGCWVRSGRCGWCIAASGKTAAQHTRSIQVW